MTDVATESVDTHEQALEVERHFRLVLTDHADACVRARRWECALAAYEALLVLDPVEPMILAGRAFVLGQLGRFEEAVEDLSRAMRLAPDEAFLYECRAAACIRLGRVAHIDEDLRALARIRAAGNVRGRVE